MGKHLHGIFQVHQDDGKSNEREDGVSPWEWHSAEYRVSGVTNNAKWVLVNYVKRMLKTGLVLRKHE